MYVNACCSIIYSHEKLETYKSSLTAAADAKSLQSCLILCDPRDGAHQAPLSLGFSRQEYWSGLWVPSLAH